MIKKKKVLNINVKFKVGDEVKNKNSGKIGIIKSLPGMPEYDKNNFSSADKGFVLEGGVWEYQKDYQIYKPSIEKFKLGDRVRFVSGLSRTRFKGLGTIVALIDYEGDLKLYSVKRDDDVEGSGIKVDGRHTWAVLKTDVLELAVKLVNPTPPFYVDCPTEEIWDKVEKKMFDMGYKWSGDSIQLHHSSWHRDICIVVEKSKRMGYSDKKFFMDSNGEYGSLIPYKKFLGTDLNIKIISMKKVEKVYEDMKKLEKVLEKVIDNFKMDN